MATAELSVGSGAEAVSHPTPPPDNHPILLRFVSFRVLMVGWLVGVARTQVRLFVGSERVNVDMHSWLAHSETHPMNWVVR